MDFETMMGKYEEAKIMRDFDVALFQDAIVKALGGKK
jgi:hypothetical protein